MLKPLHNRLVVERLAAEQTTATGLIIPDTAKEKPAQGRVVSVGPGAPDKAGKVVPMDVAVGDTVLFTKYGGTDITLDGRDYLILKEDDVLGVLPAHGSARRSAASAAPVGAASSGRSARPAATRKATARKPVARAATRATPKKSVAKKAAAKKTVAKKAGARKPAAKKATPAKRSAGKAKRR